MFPTKERMECVFDTWNEGWHEGCCFTQRKAGSDCIIKASPDRKKSRFWRPTPRIRQIQAIPRTAFEKGKRKNLMHDPGIAQNGKEVSSFLLVNCARDNFREDVWTQRRGGIKGVQYSWNVKCDPQHNKEFQKSDAIASCRMWTSLDSWL